MVKKILLSLLLTSSVLVLSAKDNRQDGFYRHSAYAGYGTCSVFSFHNPATYTFDIVNPRYFGTINAGYEYRLFKMFGVGADFSWGGKIFDEEKTDSYGRKYISQGHRENMFCILGSFRGIWIDRPLFSLYSTLKLGASIYSIDGIVYPASTNDPAQKVEYEGFSRYFQFVPVGIELGYDRWRAFIEGGFGVQGFVTGGIRVGF